MPSASCSPFISAAGVFNSAGSLGTLNSAQRASCGLEAIKIRTALAPSRMPGGRRTRKNRKNRKGRKGGKSRRNRH
jgi:hypothetical protein